MHFAIKTQDYKTVWLLSWPVMVFNISQPLLGLVDTAVIGHLDESVYLAAVAIGTTLFSFIYWSFGFLRMGTTGIVAQKVGALDGAAKRTVLAQSLVLAISIAIFLLIFQSLIIPFGLQLLTDDLSILPQASAYAAIRVYGAPAVLCQYVLLGWFVGNQNTKVLLILLVSTNLLNILLDIIAVNVLGMKADGLAAATVVSEYFGLLLAMYFCREMLKKVTGKVSYHLLRSIKAYYPIIKVNRYLFIRTVLLLFSMSFFTAQGAKLGADTLAANAVLMTFVMLISHGLDGFAHALEALTGKAVGGGELKQFYRFVTVASICAALMAMGCSLFFYLLGHSIINALTSIKAVQLVASAYLPWVIILPLVAVTSYLLDGVFIGTTQVKVMQNAMLVSVLCIFLPVWWMSQSWQNHGLWAALLSLYLGRAITSLYGFYWLTKHKNWCVSQV